MTDAQIRFYVEEESIGVIHMADQQDKNVLSLAFARQLRHCISAASEHPEVKVLLLKGLEDVFCAGGDLTMLIEVAEDRQAVDNNADFTKTLLLTKMLLDIPVPVAAAMEGHAVGGGLALGLCADIAVLAEESRYGCSFMNMGFTPGMGITRLMEHFISPAIAYEMLYTGINYKGKSLRQKTHFNYILPRDKVLTKAMELCRAIAEKPRQSLTTLKRYLSIPRRRLFEEAFGVESLMHEITFKQSETIKHIEQNYVR